MDNTLLDSVLWNCYEDPIRKQFQYHPNSNAIVNALKKKQLTFNEIDIVFHEAEIFTLAKLMKYPRGDLQFWLG